MPPPKWDDESSEETSSEEESGPGTRGPAVVTARRKFDDEEDSDDVADNWEEEDSEAEREKARAAAAAKAKAEAEAAKNKKTKSQRIEDHREAARRRRQEEENESAEEEEDEASRRARLRKAEQDSDLANAADLLSGADLLGPKDRKAVNKAAMVEDKSQPGAIIDLSQLALFQPSTKTQFEALSATLVPLLTASATKPHYALWVQQFVRAVCEPLPSGEIKKAASGLTALSNEKMKEEKAAEKGGKKTKAAAQKTSLKATRDLGRGVADTTSYDDDGLGDEDFF